MTITHPTHTRSVAPAAVAAGAAALLLMLIGTYLDTPYRGRLAQPWGIDTDSSSIGEFLLLVAFAVVGAAVVFAVVGRGLRLAPERAAVRSLVMAVAGVASLVVFWAGLPCVLAAGAAVLALDTRRRLRRTPASARIALALAACTVIAAAGISITG
jgi:lysylphosphatidylglycerol synthetase-like protein (DUF2156 family)